MKIVHPKEVAECSSPEQREFAASLLECGFAESQLQAHYFAAMFVADARMRRIGVALFDRGPPDDVDLDIATATYLVGKHGGPELNPVDMDSGGFVRDFLELTVLGMRGEGKVCELAISMTPLVIPFTAKFFEGLARHAHKSASELKAEVDMLATAMMDPSVSRADLLRLIDMLDMDERDTEPN